MSINSREGGRHRMCISACVHCSFNCLLRLIMFQRRRAICCERRRTRSITFRTWWCFRTGLGFTRALNFDGWILFFLASGPIRWRLWLPPEMVTKAFYEYLPQAFVRVVCERTCTRQLQASEFRSACTVMGSCRVVLSVLAPCKGSKLQE